MALRSKLFTIPPNKKLEDCAKSDPHHIMQGVNDQGSHVAMIQTALLLLTPSLNLPPIRLDDLMNRTYGESTAAAVLKYKQKSAIINLRYQHYPDSIVGIMTMASLDKAMLALENRPSLPTPKLPVPPPPAPAPLIRRITFRSSTRRDAENNAREDTGKDLTKALTNIAGSLFFSEGVFTLNEDKSARRIQQFPPDFRVNAVNVDVTLTFEIIGSANITNITTTRSYEWGSPFPNVTIVETDQKTILGVESSPTLKRSFVPRAEAEKKILFVIPPTP